MGWRLAGVQRTARHGEVTQCMQERQVAFLMGLSLDPKGTNRSCGRRELIRQEHGSFGHSYTHNASSEAFCYLILKFLATDNSV